MNELKSYLFLKETNKNLFSVNFNEEKIKDGINRLVESLSKLLMADLSVTFGIEPVLLTHSVYYDDKNYRQGATPVVFYFKVNGLFNLQLTVDCLLQFGKILLSVSQAGLNEESSKLASIIGLDREKEFSSIVPI